MENKDFIHLHLHDEYSVLDGFGRAKDYCKRAKELGFTSLALTNHGNIDGCITFQKECKDAGIKPIFGFEGYIVSDLYRKEKETEKRYHITILARNETGWRNILQMLSVANINGYYRRPRIDPELLLDHCDGLCIGTACASSFLNMPKLAGLSLLRRLKNKGVPCFIEVMPLDLEEQRKLNRLGVKWSDDYGIPLVATNDCHYVLQKDSFSHEVLLAMQAKKTWNDPKRWKFSIDNLFLHSTEEMAGYFKKYGGIEEKHWREAMKNTALIGSLCDFKIEKQEVYLPKIEISGYENLTPDEQLMELVLDGFQKKIVKPSRMVKPEYYSRLEEEIGIICGLGFSSYFLIVFELINWCRENDIMTGPGRGSVGGSLVAYCLGITKVDPIKYDLVFSRFISEARIDLPDIDMDFQKSRRKDVIQHLKDLYGEYNVAGISNFMKMKGKSALRKVSRVFSIPEIDVSKACDAIITRSGGDMRSDFCIADAFETFEDGRMFKSKYPKEAELAMQMEGLIMGHGRHAAGICVSKDDLREGVKTNFAERAGTLVCNWEKNDAEYNGLMKLDILGLVSLDVLQGAKKLIKSRKGIDINFESIPLDDKKTLAEFSLGNCIGVFQFGGTSIMRFCRELGIDKFEDVVDMTSLHRPGTLKSGTINQFIDRKHGRERVQYPNSIIKSITQSTQGIFLYQEQAMRLMFECAGLPWKTADTIRKAISKSQGEEQMMKFHGEFVKGCLEKETLTEKEADEVFTTIKTFGSYGFNKSHAVEYSLISYWQMYLKVNHTPEYFAAILTWGDDGKKEELIPEARRLGLKILLPDINDSGTTEWKISKQGHLLIPLLEIKGIGEKAVEEIGQRRSELNRPILDLNDLAANVNKRVVNSKIRRLLEETYCFVKDKDSLNLSEKDLEQLSTLFNFSLSNDPMYKYRGILSVIGDHIPYKNLKDCDTGDYVLCYTKKITFQIKSDKDRATYSGCYALVSDDAGNYLMANFDRALYKAKKDLIEHSGEKWVFLKVQSKDAERIMASEILFVDDFLKGNFEGLAQTFYWTSTPSVKKVRLLEPRKIDIQNSMEKYTDRLCNCSRCDLRQECSSPVYPSAGVINAMIIGEAPGRNEDKQGKGFVGDAGDILWYGREAIGAVGLSTFGIERQSVYVSNFVKCYPSVTKTPKAKSLSACSIWWKKEVSLIKPFVILAFGNTSLKVLKGQQSGIMTESGTVEWRDDLKCYVVYCLHPAAILYEPANAEIYNKGILSFANIYLNCGFGW